VHTAATIFTVKHYFIFSPTIHTHAYRGKPDVHRAFPQFLRSCVSTMAFGPCLLYGFLFLFQISYAINGHTILEGVRNPETGIDVAQLIDSAQNEERQVSKLDRVLKILQGLQNQINQLKSRVEDIHKLQADLNATKRECEQTSGNDNEHHFDVTNCGNKTRNEGKYFVADGTFGTWENHVFCRIFSTKRLPAMNYAVTADMYNVIGYHGVDYGFPGIAYNIENNQNFDFVYIRLHRKNSCFQTGYVQNNMLQWVGTDNGPCADGPPKGRTWFKFQVFVRENEAQLYLDDIQIHVLKPHFPPIARGGVIIAAGQQNVVRFRNFNISAIKPYRFSVYNCKSYHRVSSEYYRLDAKHGAWPDSGFCKAIRTEEISHSSYAISTSLFNQRGFTGTANTGYLGVMFNAQDQYNFDFVYFRPGSFGGCYNTGFVQNTVINWVNSKIGACPGGRFSGGVWHNVTVYVRGDDVSIELDGKHLVTTKAHYPNRAVGGVILGNGVDGVASFKYYRVTPIDPSSFEIYDCTRSTRSTKQYHILDAKHGDFPQDTFCRAFSKDIISGDNYFISADLFIQGWQSVETGSNFVGLAFNAKDASNYDFIYVTPKKSGFCYRMGYVMNGVVQFSGILEGKCPGGPPRKGVWFKMTVAVRGSSATISLDGKHLMTANPHFHVFSRGGVIVANGDRNVLTFRNYQSKPIHPFQFVFSRCGRQTHQTNGSFVLDGMYPKWPLNAFCSALYKPSLNSLAKRYFVEAKLNNVESWLGSDWGNPGLMFNALDENNYEYAYVRLHEKESCFQFGSVFNGMVRERKANTGSCNGMRPKRDSWFTMRVQVHSKNEAQLYINNVLIASHVASIPWYPRGGVVVANGFKNIIMFREFRIFAKK